MAERRGLPAGNLMSDILSTLGAINTELVSNEHDDDSISENANKLNYFLDEFGDNDCLIVRMELCLHNEDTGFDEIFETVIAIRKREVDALE